MADLGSTALAWELCSRMVWMSDSDQSKIRCLRTGTVLRLDPDAVVVSWKMCVRSWGLVERLKDRTLVPCLMWKKNVDCTPKVINICVYAYLRDWQIVMAFIWHNLFFSTSLFFPQNLKYFHVFMSFCIFNILDSLQGRHLHWLYIKACLKFYRFFKKM